MEEEGRGGGSRVGGGRQLHLSFVSFQQERERANFFRSTDNLGTRERGSGRERVHSRHSKREKGAEPYEKKSASRERHGELFA